MDKEALKFTRRTLFHPKEWGRSPGAIIEPLVESAAMLGIFGAAVVGASRPVSTHTIETEMRYSERRDNTEALEMVGVVDRSLILASEHMGRLAARWFEHFHHTEGEE